MPDEAPAPAEIYVSAFFCQDVIRDKKTDLLTAIKITNAFTVPWKTLEGGEVSFKINLHPQLALNAVITFTSTKAIGFDYRIRGFDPSGKELTPPPPPTRCDLEGGAAGQTVNVAMRLPTDKAGDYWFEIYVDDAVKTRMPLRIIHDATVHPSMSQQAKDEPASE
jgi:hypothetical protein